MADNEVPGAWPVWTLRDMVVRFYKEDYLTLLHTKYKSSMTHGFMVSLLKDLSFIFISSPEPKAHR